MSFWRKIDVMVTLCVGDHEYEYDIIIKNNNNATTWLYPAYNHEYTQQITMNETIMCKGTVGNSTVATSGMQYT